MWEGEPVAAVIGMHIEEHMGIEQAFANFFKASEGGHVALMHAAAWEPQQDLGVWQVRSIEIFISPQETVIAHDLPPSLWVFEAGVEARGRAAVRREFGNRHADARAFIFAEREWFVVECASDVARLQRPLAEHAGNEVGVIRRVAGAVPEIILILSPNLAGQKAALVTADLAEVAQMIPLSDDQIGFERATVLHEHFVERSFVGDLREAQHLAPERRGLRRIMPSHDVIELVRIQIGDGKTLLELLGGEVIAQILAEAAHAIFAVAIMTVKVIRNKTIHTSRDAVTDPGFQHLAPLGIVQARPILAHTTDAVSFIRNWFPGFVFLQKVERIGDRLWSEQLFIPLIAIEFEKATRALRTIRIAHEKFYIEMADHFHSASM